MKFASEFQYVPRFARRIWILGEPIGLAVVPIFQYDCLDRLAQGERAGQVEPFPAHLERGETKKCRVEFGWILRRVFSSRMLLLCGKSAVSVQARTFGKPRSIR